MPDREYGAVLREYYAKVWRKARDISKAERDRWLAKIIEFVLLLLIGAILVLSGLFAKPGWFDESRLTIVTTGIVVILSAFWRWGWALIRAPAQIDREQEQNI